MKVCPIPRVRPASSYRAGSGGSQVGVLRFSFCKALQNPQWELVELDEKVGSLTAIKDYVDAYVNEFDRLLGDPIGESLVALDSRQVVVRQSESNLGNLITDSVATWFSDYESDLVLAMFNGGSIRGDRLSPAAGTRQGQGRVSAELYTSKGREKMVNKLRPKKSALSRIKNYAKDIKLSTFKECWDGSPVYSFIFFLAL